MYRCGAAALLLAAFAGAGCEAAGMRGVYQPPTVSGHFLTKKELDTIGSIACLQAKQDNPAIKCTDGKAVSATQGVGGPFQGPLSVTNFPTPKDTICHSVGSEAMCDPQDALTITDWSDIASQLKKSRQESHVQCGSGFASSATPGSDKRFFAEFHLGVVVLKDWPAIASDPDTLQTFGMIHAANWNMSEFNWLHGNCPNLGLLVVLTGSRQAFLSTPSCDFICQERGAPTVVNKVLVTLDTQGEGAAVKAGIKAVYDFITMAPSIHEADEYKPVVDHTHDFSGDLSNFTQRVVFGVVLALFVLSIFVACLVMSVAPGIVAKRGKL